MDARKMKMSDLPTTNLMFSEVHAALSADEVQYLYNLTGDEDLTREAYARAKDLSVDVLMTNYVQGYGFRDSLLAADILLPVIPVRAKLGTYKKYGQEAANIFVSDEGDAKGNTNEIFHKIGEGTYETINRKLKTFVDDDEIAANGALEPMKEATENLKYGLDLRNEIRVRNLADATAIGVTIGTDWDTATTVHTDIALAKTTIQNTIGAPATHIQFNEDVANQLLANVAQGAGIFGTVPSPFDVQAALRMQDGRAFFKPNTRPWGLIPVITNAMYNTADDLEAAESLSYVWPDACYVFRVDPRGRNSGWGFQAELMPTTIIRWRDEDRGGWYVKAIRKRKEIEATAGAIYEMLDVT